MNNPELYAWNIDWDKWTERFIHPQTRVKDWDDLYMKVLREYGFPIARFVWGMTGDSWNKDITSENFLAKYTPSAQGHLDSHIDDSSYSITLALNEDFEGGETWYHRQKTLIKAPTGHVCLFPMPTHKHSGRYIDSGTRYIIVSFVKRARY